jgi:hypothetical protein
MARGPFESVARALERSGLRTVGDLRAEAVGYRDAPPRVRALTQADGPLLDRRIREVRFWVASPGTLRYEATFRPEVFELILLAWGACLAIAALPTLLPRLALTAGALVLAVAWVRATVDRRHRELRGWLELAIRDARTESSVAIEQPLG